jgi:hypothetical protein
MIGSCSGHLRQLVDLTVSVYEYEFCVFVKLYESKGTSVVIILVLWAGYAWNLSP